MAWALKFDGVNDYCTRDTPDTFHQNLTQYSVKARLKETITSNNYLIGQSTSFNGYITLRNDGAVRVRYGATTVFFSYVRPSVNTWFDFEVQRDGDAHRLYIDGLLQDTQSSSATNNSTNLDVIGRASSNESGIELEYLSLYDAPTSGSLLYNYDATASSHGAGTPVLVDTIGSNDATGVNMPTDGSAWVNLGGSGIEVTPSTINSVSVSNDPTVSFASVLNIEPSSINSSSASLNPSIDFASVLNINPSVIDSSSISNDPTILFSGTLNIAPSAIDSASISNDPSILFASTLNIAPNVINSDSTSNDPIVSFTSALNIFPSTVNSESLTLDPLVEFKSIINVLPNAIDSLSISLNPVITTGEVQDIGNITASFKDSGISVKYQQDQITVNFK